MSYLEVVASRTSPVAQNTTQISNARYNSVHLTPLQFTAPLLDGTGSRQIVVGNMVCPGELSIVDGCSTFLLSTYVQQSVHLCQTRPLAANAAGCAAGAGPVSYIDHQ